MFKIQSQEPQCSKSKFIHAEKRFLNDKFILKQHKKMIKTNTITLFILPLQVSGGTNKRKTNAHGADFRHGKAIYSLTKILIHET